jgi:hypothetical protein
MPLFLHELQHAIVTAPSGARPKPVNGEHSDEMRAVPVLCEIVGNELEGGLTLQVVGFELGKFTYQGRNVARLLLRVVLPEGHRIVADVAPDIQNQPPADAVQFEPFPVDWTPPREGGVIPELERFDPEIFRANTDRPAGRTASGKGTGENVPNAGDAKDGN